MNVDLDIHTLAQHILAQIVLRTGFFDGGDQNFRALRHFATDVNVGGLGADGITGDDHPFDQLVRVIVHQLPVFEGPRLGLVSVADQINRLAGAFGKETPFQSTGETSAAPTADFAVLDLIYNFFRLQAKRLAQRSIAARLFVIRQRSGVAWLGNIRE